MTTYVKNESYINKTDYQDLNKTRIHSTPLGKIKTVYYPAYINEYISYDLNDSTPPPGWDKDPKNYNPAFYRSILIEPAPGFEMYKDFYADGDLTAFAIAKLYAEIGRQQSFIDQDNAVIA